jgi:hypothetical protein
VSERKLIMISYSHTGRSQLPELDGDAYVEALSDDAAHIARTLKSLPAPNTNQSCNPLQSALLDISSVELGQLVELRFAHQTKQAASGVRKTVGRKQSEKQKTLTEKQVLVRELEAIIKEQAEIGPGTGVERAIRWTGRNPAAQAGGRDGNMDGEVAAVPAAGNSANAVAVATASARTVSHLKLTCIRRSQAESH